MKKKFTYGVKGIKYGKKGNKEFISEENFSSLAPSKLKKNHEKLSRGYVCLEELYDTTFNMKGVKSNPNRYLWYQNDNRGFRRPHYIIFNISCFFGGYKIH